MTDTTTPAADAPATDLAVTAGDKISYAAVEMSAVGAGGGSLAVKTLGEAVGFAAVMARADIALPQFLRGQQGACLAITMQAMRWEMDPFAVANKAYSVNNRLAYEAQLVAAVVITRAPIARRPDYTYEGVKGGTRTCTVSVMMRDGTVKEYTTPEVGKITTKNSPLWKSDEDQQLGYFAIRSWARRHAPEVLLGVYTPDEILDNPDIVRNVTPRPTTGLAARLEAAGGADSVEGFNASRATRQAEDVAHAAAAGEQVDATTGEVLVKVGGDRLGEILQAATEGGEAMDAVVEKHAAEAKGGPDDALDPGEEITAWAVEAAQLIDAAADKAALDMLNEAWTVEGRWSALKAYSKADHTGLPPFAATNVAKTPLVEYVKKTGEVPPGCVFEPEGDQFYVK